MIEIIMDNKDYYRILGVDKNASGEEIKKAYRKMAHQYHPDKTGGSGDRFKEINEAYQVLSSKEKRQQYDQFGRVFDGGAGGASPNWGGFDFGQGFPGAGFSSQGGPASGWDFNFGDGVNLGGDFGSIFEGIFEGLGVRKKRRTVHSGSDLRLNLAITLEEVATGSQKELEYETLVKCQVCQGRGFDKDSSFKTCDACDGRGEVKETRQSFFGPFTRIKSCSHCFGEGKIPEKICKECRGRGRIKAKKLTRVNIQPGINDGQIIKITGAGEDGEKGASSGDLYLEVNVKLHHLFRRQGADLLYEKKISIPQAVLGAETEIPGLIGKPLLIKVPAGTESGKILRIKGKGLSYFGRFGSGDLLIKVDILIPKKVSSKAKKLLEELQEEIQ